MVIRKSQLFDFIVYLFGAIFLIIDLVNCISKTSSIFVVLSFVPILFITLYIFFREDGFLTIDQMLSVYLFMFCYYTPLHQYVDNVNIHGFSPITTTDYAFANLLIILFLLMYVLGRKVRKKNHNLQKFTFNIRLNSISLLILAVLSIGCVLWLQSKHVLFSLNEVASISSDKSLSVVILKIIRFIPISSLLLYLYALKDKTISGSYKFNTLMFAVIGIVCFIIFFPINGTISRYLLFGTYLMILHALFERYNHKSIILIIAFLGFYYVFPAFNFFKFHSIDEIGQFALGGFDSSFIDYDAYEMFVQSIHYVSKEGLLWGKNIITALLCFIPRKIWTGKLNQSGALVAGYYGTSFTNLSCPIYAEFYLAFGVLGIVFFSYLFARLVNFIEEGNKTNNTFFRSVYSISVGMTIPLSRGALLPMTSFFISLVISLIICCLVCQFSIKKGIQR